MRMKGYDAAKVTRGRTREDRDWRATCEVCGVIAKGETEDDMIDAGATHDEDIHGYDGMGDYEN